MELAYILYFALWSTKGSTSPFLTVASMATTLLGSAAMLLLGLGAFTSGAKMLGAMLLVLGVPGNLLFFSARNALTGTTEISQQLAVTTTVLFGADLGVVEACLFALLGVMLLGGARGQALAREEEENREKALRLYEVGLGENYPSVVEEVVSKDFNDPRRGLRDKGGMRRSRRRLLAHLPVTPGPTGDGGPGLRCHSASVPKRCS